MHPRTVPRPLLLRFLPCLLILLFPSAARAESPWKVLEEMRESLAAAGATAADFVQTYVPAGFTSGEREAGRLALEVPDCLRWDYELPAEKSFLLCGNVVHTWNPEDPVGQRYFVQPEREPGLDLMLLSADDLSLRYRAESRAKGRGRVEVTLAPVAETAQLQQARMLVDSRRHRLLELEYRDREGNVTRFEISGYRPLGDRRSFVPPEDREWQEN